MVTLCEKILHTKPLRHGFIFLLFLMRCYFLESLKVLVALLVADDLEVIVKVAVFTTPCVRFCMVTVAVDVLILSVWENTVLLSVSFLTNTSNVTPALGNGVEVMFTSIFCVAASVANTALPGSGVMVKASCVSAGVGVGVDPPPLPQLVNTTANKTIDTIASIFLTKNGLLFTMILPYLQTPGTDDEVIEYSGHDDNSCQI